jgi:uncharacterized membrane protein YfcA
VANVSNTLGLMPGSFSGVVGYRRELVGQRSRLMRYGAAGAAGGLTGGLVLLAAPESAFEAVVPFLILLACGLMAFQPRLSRFMAARRGAEAGHPWGLLVAVFLTGIYGGYFGAAQGVILIALLAIFLTDDLQRLNGLKNWIAGVINAVAAVLFILVAPVDYGVAALLALGSIVGGQVGATVGRRLPSPVLRATVVSVGLIVAIRMLLG